MATKKKVAKKAVVKAVKKSKKINCSAMVKQLAAGGMASEKILKKVQKYNPNFKARWVTALTERIRENPETVAAPTVSTSVLSLRRGHKVIRVYPPKAGEYPARQFPGVVKEITAEKIICDINIVDDQHSQTMEFDLVTGIGMDNTGHNTGAFIIKR